MYLFEGNQSNILRIKSQMTHPQQFMPVATVAYVLYIIAALLMGVMSCLVKVEQGLQGA
jgi:hypothetical protein